MRVCRGACERDRSFGSGWPATGLLRGTVCAAFCDAVVLAGSVGTEPSGALQVSIQACRSPRQALTLFMVKRRTHPKQARTSTQRVCRWQTQRRAQGLSIERKPARKTLDILALEKELTDRQGYVVWIHPRPQNRWKLSVDKLDLVQLDDVAGRLKGGTLYSYRPAG